MKEEYPAHVVAAIERGEALSRKADVMIVAGRAAIEDKFRAEIFGTNVPRAKGRVAPSPYRSQLEADYAQRLELQRIAGEVLAWTHEGIRLALGGGAWYKPDFLIVGADCELTIAETKGEFAREASLVRIKVAAARFSYLRFVMVRRSKEGEWTEQEIRP